MSSNAMAHYREAGCGARVCRRLFNSFDLVLRKQPLQLGASDYAQATVLSYHFEGVATGIGVCHDNALGVTGVCRKDAEELLQNRSPNWVRLVLALNGKLLN